MSKYVKPMLLTQELNGGVNIGGWSGESFDSDPTAPQETTFNGRVVYVIPSAPGWYFIVENGKFVPYMPIP